jgi:hypothetical protein
MERLANSDPFAVLHSLRRHPFMISAPLAALAVGAGIGAHALLRPGTSASKGELLDTLIASPKARPTQAAAAESLAPPSGGEVTAATGMAAPSTGAGGLTPPNLQAQRAAAPASAGGGLIEPQAGPSLNLEIRVALLKLPAYPDFAASGSWRLLDRDGRVLRQGSAAQAPDPAASLAQEPEVWLETGANDHLSSAGHSYQGRFRILRSSNGLRVINHLPLESYVSSVVGGEMPSSWNREALRAQAVAARSYALAHMARPADDQWHLGDTTRWQNYEGLSSVTATTRDATSSTNGVILSYQGGIVESLYAATQQIVEEAHGSLGASMSQTGAQELAQQGLRYNEILGRYYQGASLARLQAGAG